MEDSKKTRGRTRSKEAEEAVLNAAYRLLVDRGLQAATVDAIAAESKVSKATIYKWWPNRAAIIMSAFLRESLVAIPYPKRLALEVVLERLRNMSGQFEGPVGRLMAALIAEGQSDPAIAEEFREGYIKQRRAEGVQIVESSIQDGTVRDADPQVILDVLYAPLYYRLLVGHQPLSPAFVQEYLDLVMRGILVRPEQPLQTGAAPTKRAPRKPKAAAK
jgi:AcrR family transcriptional regulator